MNVLGVKIPARRARQAFTLLELLVVIAIIAILASLLLPVLANAKKTALAASGINNLKQLTVAAQLYANDYADAIVPNAPGGPTSWVTGSVQGLPGAINIADITNSLLYPYGGSAKIYQCPADTITIAGSSAQAHPQFLIELHDGRQPGDGGGRSSRRCRESQIHRHRQPRSCAGPLFRG